ncbi:hypothetical protein G6F43_011733 [Rhizopus delemar]|nr:hypothetical protein G6F43_011733 [Rhizopus delemar]
MGNCMPLMHTAHTKYTTHVGSKSMASAQEITTAVDPTNHTTINTNREFHNEESATYWLPKDEDEQKRLTGQHFGCKELFGGNVLNSIRDTLDFEKGISILDVGCGSGIWDMINDYPNCTYHGCDIADVTNKVLAIKQFTYKHGNVVKGLPYADSMFDFVHMRFFVYALRKEEWPIAIKELIRVVKPGGMLQLTEADPQLPKDSSSIVYTLTNTFNSIAISKGQNIEIAQELEGLLSAHDNVKVVQSDDRRCNMSSGTATAKKLVWDVLEATKSVIDLIGPMLGIKDKQDVPRYLDELKHCLTHTDCYFCVRSVSAKKL